jgi:hypothetical protein
MYTMYRRMEGESHHDFMERDYKPGFRLVDLLTTDPLNS